MVLKTKTRAQGGSVVATLPAEVARRLGVQRGTYNQAGRHHMRAPHFSCTRVYTKSTTGRGHSAHV